MEFVCNKCNKNFVTYNKLTYHQNQVHCNIIEKTCIECKKILSSIDNLNIIVFAILKRENLIKEKKKTIQLK